MVGSLFNALTRKAVDGFLDFNERVQGRQVAKKEGGYQNGRPPQVRKSRAGNLHITQNNYYISNSHVTIRQLFR